MCGDAAIVEETTNCFFFVPSTISISSLRSEIEMSLRDLCELKKTLTCRNRVVTAIVERRRNSPQPEKGHSLLFRGLLPSQ